MRAGVAQSAGLISNLAFVSACIRFSFLLFGNLLEILCLLVDFSFLREMDFYRQISRRKTFHLLRISKVLLP